MTRLQLLHLVIARARANGFEFRRWYTARLGLPWISTEAAVTLLDAQRRYYSLVFSHEFASAFWKPGADITFEVRTQQFQRVMTDGTARTVERKGFIRRSARPNAWRYHLQQMALAEDPLRHLRKYMHIEETLDAEPESAAEMAKVASDKRKRITPEPVAAVPRPKSSGARPKIPPNLRPLPADLPAFLKKPYKRA